jgi:hypothetical protein
MIESQRKLCGSRSFGRFNVHIYTSTNCEDYSSILRLTGSKPFSDMVQGAQDNEVTQL